MRDTAPTNNQPISFSMRERVSTPTASLHTSAKLAKTDAGGGVEGDSVAGCVSDFGSVSVSARVGQTSKPSARMRAKNQTPVAICPSGSKPGEAWLTVHPPQGGVRHIGVRTVDWSAALLAIRTRDHAAAQRMARAWSASSSASSNAHNQSA